MPEPLLQTKLYIPPPRSEIVHRGRLIEKLNQSVSKRVTLLSAPTGYGKTTLLSAWASKSTVPVAWFSLDGDDNDPAQFLRYVANAFGTIAPQVGQVSLVLLSATPPSPISTVLITLLNELTTTTDELFLVLDDYHQIKTDEVHETLGTLIDRMPEQLHIILASRVDPPFGLGRLRARGELLEIRQADLRFTTEEIAKFMELAAQLELTDDQLSTLAIRTEGWIAGLQLAALSLPGKADVATFIDDFSGSHRFIIDFLAEEVLAQQPEALANFLIRTSVLERLNGSLCDAVTGGNDSTSTLINLEEDNLFLLALDGQREWFRYHQLFRDFLRTQLDEDESAVLHARAAKWLLANELYSEAVRHALASGNLDLVIGAVNQAAPVAFNRGSHSALLGWLSHIPEERLLENSELAIFKGFALLLTSSFDVAMPYATAAEQALPQDAPPSTRGRLLSLKANIALCQDEPDRCIQLSREALSLLAEEDHLFRNLTNNVLGQLLEMNGDVAAAAGVYEQAYRSSWRLGDQMGALVIFSNLIFALNEIGRRQEGLALCQQMETRGKGATFQQVPLLEAVNLPKSLLSYEGNDLEAALEQVQRALLLLTAANFSQGIVWGKYILARIYLALGRFNNVLETARDGYKVALEIGQESLHGTWFAALEAQSWLQQGNLGRAIQWAEASGFSSDDKPNHWLEYPYFTYVRLLITQDRLPEATQLLGSMAVNAREGGRDRKLITIHLLQATCLEAIRKRDEAVAHVAQAIKIAQPGGYLRAFINEGKPVVQLLPTTRASAPAFVDAISELLDAKDQGAAGAGNLVEALSQRELQVLDLVAMGLSNREIAAKLVVTVGTIKKHLNNIFSKLGVKSRTQAVARAREIGLLD